MYCAAYKGGWRQYNSLLDALEIDAAHPVITAVGAGGKTTIIKRLAAEFRAMGKKVLITTVTHMMREEGCVLSGSISDIRAALDSGSCFAGMPCGEKVCALPDSVLKEAVGYADAVLIEGDGSRRLPVKYPNESEPVIIPETTDVIVVMGASALGQDFAAAAHRHERIKECIGLEGTITAQGAAALINEGYIKRLSGNYRIHCVINQADAADAGLICRFVRADSIAVTSFAMEERNDL